MIVVVADTSPLNYLIQIDCEHIFPALYERVFVPATVVEELDHKDAGTRFASHRAVTSSGMSASPPARLHICTSAPIS